MTGSRPPLTVAILLAVGLLAACSGGEETAPEPRANPLYVDPATRDFSDNPALLERILDSPHGYFRFINIPFSREVCRRFGGALEGTPPFNLHGDAVVCSPEDAIYTLLNSDLDAIQIEHFYIERVRH